MEMVKKRFHLRCLFSCRQIYTASVILFYIFKNFVTIFSIFCDILVPDMKKNPARRAAKTTYGLGGRCVGM